MNPEDQNYGAGAEAVHQADSIQKQMSIAEEAARPDVPAVDNSILANLDDEESKTLSDIIHQGTTNPTTAAPTLTTDTTAQKGKHPINKKFIVAIIGIVFAIGAVALIIWLIVGIVVPAIGAEQGGATADPNRLAFFIDNTESLSAVYNDKGEQLTEFKYRRITDFNAKGYAVVATEDRKQQGIITNTGELSVLFGKYASIDEFGAFFIARDEQRADIVIDGTGRKIEDSFSNFRKYGVYENYDGAENHIYDKNGELLGKSDKSNILIGASEKNGVACFQNGAQINCVDTRTGEKIFTAEHEDFSKGEFRLSSVGEKNRNCALFQNATDESIKYPFYYGETLSPLDDIGGLIVSELPGNTSGCFFYGISSQDSHQAIAGGDGIAIDLDNLDANTARIFIRDSTHYAYVKNDSNFKNGILRIGDEALEISDERMLYVGGNKDYLTVYSDGQISFYKDRTEPYFSVEGAGYQIYNTTDLDENDNIIVGGSLYHKDGTLLYEAPNSYLSYLNGKYYASASAKTNAPHVAVIDKNGHVLVDFPSDEDADKHDRLTLAGDYIIMHKTNGTYSLLDSSCKEVLSDYKNIEVFDSHIEAIRDNKIFYFTLDLKQLN